MRFKIDENLHDDVAALLAGEGFDVETVHSEGIRGCADPVLAQHCAAENRAIIMLDLDFGDIRAFPPATTPGILLLRVHDQSRPTILRVMRQVIDLLKTEAIRGRLWVVTDAGVRIRDGSP
jgi:predicted nuclease of predicted toxin-antitoxin system